MPLNEDGLDRNCPEYWMGYLDAITAVLQRSRNLLVRAAPNELSGVSFILRMLRDFSDAATKRIEELREQDKIKS